MQRTRPPEHDIRSISASWFSSGVFEGLRSHRRTGAAVLVQSRAADQAKDRYTDGEVDRRRSELPGSGPGAAGLARRLSAGCPTARGSPARRSPHRGSSSLLGSAILNAGRCCGYAVTLRCSAESGSPPFLLRQSISWRQRDGRVHPALGSGCSRLADCRATVGPKRKLDQPLLAS